MTTAEIPGWRRVAAYACAGLAEALIPFALGLMLLLWRTPPYPEQPWPLDNFIAMFLTYFSQITFLALPTGLLFIVAMAFLERTKPKKPTTWLLIGLVAITPTVFTVWVAGNMGDCIGKCPERDQLMPVLVVYGLGLLGAAVAARIRQWVWKR